MLQVSVALWVHTAFSDESSAEELCLSADEVYEISGGEYPEELIWQGKHYSSTCDCGSTAGISGEAFACVIGQVCRCGTFNGQPWMGEVIHRPGTPVPNFGSSKKPFIREDRFFLFFAEVNLVKNRIGCLSDRREAEREYVCYASANTIITLTGGDGRSLRSVTLYWKGQLPDEIASGFAVLYGGPNQSILRKELGRSTPRSGRRSSQFRLGKWLRGWHDFYRAERGEPAEHWVTIR